MDRRVFAKVATATLATALTPDRADAAALPLAATPAAPTPPQEQQPSAEARALGEWIRARYGDRLSANEFADVVRDIESGERRAARLNAPPLANGDEPDFIFRPYRGAD
jgi:hypothetical protein